MVILVFGGRSKVSAVGCVVLLALLTATSSSMPVRGAMVASDFQTLETSGVSGRFGIVMEYTPQDVLTKPGRVVTFSYAPGPLPVSIGINILGMLEGGGYDISSFEKDVVEAAAWLVGIDDPWNWTLAVIDTPIGTHSIQSFQVVPSLPLYIDLTLEGQVNCTVSTTSGHLDRTSFVWKKWGGNEVNLTVPSSPGTLTVAASFKYFATATMSVRFNFPLFGFTLPVYSTPLGELPFQQSAQSTVEVLDPSLGASNSGAAGSGISTTSWVLIAVAVVAGLLIGIVIGRGSRRRNKRTSTPPPGWVPPPPG